MMDQEKNDLIYTIDTIINDKPLVKRLNCKLYESIQQNAFYIDWNEYDTTNQYNNIIRDLIFGDNDNNMPIILFKHVYLYKNKFDNISVLNFDELSEIVFFYMEQHLHINETQMKILYNNIIHLLKTTLRLYVD